MLFVRNFEFEEKPYYEMMRQKFRKVLHELHQNRREEIPLDWKVLRDKLRDNRRQERATKESALNYQAEGQLFISDIEKQDGSRMKQSFMKKGEDSAMQFQKQQQEESKK